MSTDSPDAARPDADFENTLRGMDRSRVPSHLEDRVFTQLRADDARAGARRWPLAVAAVALAGVAAFAWQHIHENGGAQQAATTEVVSAKGASLIVSTQPDSHSLVAREFENFEYRRVRVGDAFDDGTLQKVEADIVEVVSHGAAERATVAAHNETARKALRAEAESLAARQVAGLLTGAEFDRLQAIACFGDSTAVAALERLGAAGGSDGAEDPLSARGAEFVRVRELAAWARVGDRKSRLRTVRALAEQPSALAAQFLSALAMDGGDEVISLECVSVLRGMNNAAASEALSALSEYAGLPAVRAAAGAVSHE